MQIAHLLPFRGDRRVSWIGRLAVVACESSDPRGGLRCRRRLRIEAPAGSILLRPGLPPDGLPGKLTTEGGPGVWA